jgi:hypothetical protein
MIETRFKKAHQLQSWKREEMPSKKANCTQKKKKKRKKKKVGPLV